MKLSLFLKSAIMIVNVSLVRLFCSFLCNNPDGWLQPLTRFVVFCIKWVYIPCFVSNMSSYQFVDEKHKNGLVLQYAPRIPYCPEVLLTPTLLLLPSVSHINDS